MTDRKLLPRPAWSLPAYLLIAALSAGVGLLTHQPLAGALTLVGGASVLALYLHVRGRRRWHAVLDDFARREMERARHAPAAASWNRLPRKDRSGAHPRVAPRGA